MSKEKYQLEDEIRELIFDDNKNSAHFEYTTKVVQMLKTRPTHKDEEVRVVKLITLNKKTGATFLLTEQQANDDVRALARILDFLKSINHLHTYTIKWYVRSEGADRPYKSKFVATDIHRAIDKFYYGQNQDEYIIYSISDDNIKSKDYEGQ